MELSDWIVLVSIIVGFVIQGAVIYAAAVSRLARLEATAQADRKSSDDKFYERDKWHADHFKFKDEATKVLANHSARIEQGESRLGKLESQPSG